MTVLLNLVLSTNINRSNHRIEALASTADSGLAVNIVFELTAAMESRLVVSTGLVWDFGEVQSV